jgi:DNA-binding response OmpR family regulator
MYRRILIVDNHDSLLSVYREWLSFIGYQVCLADTTRAAEADLDRQRYHAVIYDIDAAGKRGLDFLRDHWLQFRIEDTSVVVISRNDQYRYECESMGIPYYTRPDRMRDLEKTIIGLIQTQPSVSKSNSRPLRALAQ